MSIAEEFRDTVTIILAGYKDEIETSIFATNPGMYSRFEVVNFNDFSDTELNEIWAGLCKEHYISSDMVGNIVTRRLARKRQQGKGFGNARDVRKLFELASSRADRRHVREGKKTKKIVITVADVIGEKPDANNPVLVDAFRKLDAMTGISSVKKALRDIVESTQRNYDKELAGSAPDHVRISKLFVGNPGTGKTTVAALYGTILKELGLLSKGDVVKKTPSDFMGQAVGESARNTSTILKLCEGKVLIIDEAYGLHDSKSGGGGYGTQVLDTLVEKWSGEIGEDRAVIMIGYEDQLMAMLRDSNPGLTRRFDANPFRAGLTAGVKGTLD